LVAAPFKKYNPAGHDTDTGEQDEHTSPAGSFRLRLYHLRINQLVAAIPLSRHCQLLHDAGTPFLAVLNEVQWLVMQLSREKNPDLDQDRSSQEGIELQPLIVRMADSLFAYFPSYWAGFSVAGDV
jgi:hypothetical protein